MREQTVPYTLETDRLNLRQYRTEDARSILQLIDQNREQLVREFSQQAGLRRIEETESFVLQKAEAWKTRNTFCYGIWDKSTNLQVGQIQAKNIDWEIPAAEIGYFIGKSSQRQGYATEAITRILTLAFETLCFQRIFVRILPSNKNSLALAERLGFQHEGIHRNAFRCGLGELHDVHYLSVIPSDYRMQH